MSDLFRIRPLKPEDKDFIFDSWLKSWRPNRAAGVIPNNRYFEIMREAIENVIGRGATVNVACSPDNEDKIYGYVCWEYTPDKVPVIHYLYVKDPFFKYNIDQSLIADIPDRPFHTYAYDQVRNAIEKKWGRSRGWVPEIARRE